MKIRSLLALVGLAISFASPTFAQQTNTPDPRIAQQRDLVGDATALDEFGVLATKQSEAFTNNDAAAVAALFVGRAPDAAQRAALAAWCAAKPGPIALQKESVGPPMRNCASELCGAA